MTIQIDLPSLFASSDLRFDKPSLVTESLDMKAEIINYSSLLKCDAR